MEKRDSWVMLFVKLLCSSTKLSEELREKRPPRQDVKDSGVMWDVYLRVEQRRKDPTAGTAAAPGPWASAPLSRVLLQQPQSGAGPVQSRFLTQPP